MAAVEVIRNASVFIKNRKVGTMTSAKYSIMSNNEAQIGDGRWLGTSDGVTTTSLTTDCIVPVQGLQNDLENALLNKQYLNISVGVVNGQIHKITMKVDKADYSSDSAKGTLTGSFDLSGGAPERIG